MSKKMIAPAIILLLFIQATTVIAQKSSMTALELMIRIPLSVIAKMTNNSRGEQEALNEVQKTQEEYAKSNNFQVDLPDIFEPAK